MKLVTHNARFHSDDVFAAAALLLLYPDATLTRSRDPEVIASADIVFDVGSVYDENAQRFDHHQIGGAGKRPDGTPYASFGLVWKKIGVVLAGSPDAARLIEKKLVEPIDAMDNGVDIYTPLNPDLHPYIFQTITFSHNPTWKEGDAEVDTRFFEMVHFAQAILRREIIQAQDLIEGAAFVEAAYQAAPDKQLIVLDKNYPWDEVLAKYPEPLYVVRPNVQDARWKIEAVRDDIHSYIVRKKLPESWAGKRDGELAEVTGVADAVFCHNARFMAMAGSKEGVLKLAELALQG